MRSWHDLPPLPEVEERAPMTTEDFDRRLAVMPDTMALMDAKAAAKQLSPAALDDLRRWISARLACNG